jgi:hypothetical protein
MEEFEKMSVPTINTYFGREARFYKGTTVVAHSRSLSLKASAELIKLRSNDSLQPVKTMVGEQTFTWSFERLFTGKEWLQALMSGESFDIVFAPDGDDGGADIETWKNCHITSVERKTADGVLENGSGEAENVEFPEGGGT